MLEPKILVLSPAARRARRRYTCRRKRGTTIEFHEHTDFPTSSSVCDCKAISHLQRAVRDLFEVQVHLLPEAQHHHPTA